MPPDAYEEIEKQGKVLGLTPAEWATAVVLRAAMPVQAGAKGIPGEEPEECRTSSGTADRQAGAPVIQAEAPPAAPKPVAQNVVPAWSSRPKPPAWKQPAAGDPPIKPAPAKTEAPEPVAVYECRSCKDQGGGILVECVCGRYKDQQGKVHISPDAAHGPQNWNEAWTLMEGMDSVERAEKFFEWTEGKELPGQWKTMTREVKVAWLNQNWPLS